MLQTVTSRRVSQPLAETGSDSWRGFSASTGAEISSRIDTDINHGKLLLEAIGKLNRQDPLAQSLTEVCRLLNQQQEVSSSFYPKNRAPHKFFISSEGVQLRNCTKNLPSQLNADSAIAAAHDGVTIETLRNQLLLTARKTLGIESKEPISETDITNKLKKYAEDLRNFKQQKLTESQEMTDWLKHAEQSDPTVMALMKSLKITGKVLFFSEFGRGEWHKEPSIVGRILRQIPGYDWFFATSYTGSLTLDAKGFKVQYCGGLVFPWANYSKRPDQSSMKLARDSGLCLNDIRAKLASYACDYIK